MGQEFYLLPNNRTTGFYLGERGVCGEVDDIIQRYHERKAREAAEQDLLRHLPELIDE